MGYGMKILSIGNSFSQDAHKFLNKLATVYNIDINTTNLFIGGCSLETHWDNVINDKECYDLERNGNFTGQKISIKRALKMEDWDIVTLQQVSHLSGFPETYEPYLSSLANVVRNNLCNTKLYFHQTWAYETDSQHGGFANYNNDQTEMYHCIKKASEIAAQTINAPIIPVGEVIQTLRETVPEFDYKNGGISLCRDGFHLSLDYGRYAAAATWLATFTNTKLSPGDFEDFDLKILSKIIVSINQICKF